MVMATQVVYMLSVTPAGMVRDSPVLLMETSKADAVDSSDCMNTKVCSIVRGGVKFAMKQLVKVTVSPGDGSVTLNVAVRTVRTTGASSRTDVNHYWSSHTVLCMYM